jgi:hypothetical protein
MIPVAPVIAWIARIAPGRGVRVNDTDDTDRRCAVNDTDRGCGGA